MTATSRTFLALATTCALITPLVASAQQQRGPDMGQVASDLGVSKADLQNCMPAPTGGGRPAKPDAGQIAACLKGANASLTTAQVDQVLGKYAPKRGPKT